MNVQKCHKCGENKEVCCLAPTEPGWSGPLGYFCKECCPNKIKFSCGDHPCDICKLNKPVCCSKGNQYSYCADCCPNKAAHQAKKLQTKSFKTLYETSFTGFGDTTYINGLIPSPTKSKKSKPQAPTIERHFGIAGDWDEGYWVKWSDVEQILNANGIKFKVKDAN